MFIKEVVGYVFYLGSVTICMCGKEGKGEMADGKKGFSVD